MEKALDYSEINNAMNKVQVLLKKAGHIEESKAIISICHLIAYRTNHLPGLNEQEELFDYFADCNFLNNYINDEK